MFNRACGQENLDEDVHQKLKTAIDTTNDIPLPFVGILYELVMTTPGYYWDREVADEVFAKLSTLYQQDDEKLTRSFVSSQEYFFAAVNSYLNSVTIYNELSDVGYDNSLKTRIWRNPLYSQLCEDCLMNFFRCLRDIINEYSAEDYSNQNTLGAVLPILAKHHLAKTVAIDTNIRNAIGHGNVFVNGNDVLFKYGEGSKYSTKILTLWQYDDLIDKLIDIAGGVLIAFIRFMVSCAGFVETVLTQQPDEDLHFEWMKLVYRNQTTRLLFMDRSTLGSPQLNVHLQTSIADKSSLLFSLIEVLRGVCWTFPEYDRYFVGYAHNRSPNGFVGVSRNSLDGIAEMDNAALIQRATEEQGVLLWDIQDDEVDERAYKFKLFPQPRGANWFVSGIQDCSIEDHKRIRANLIVDGAASTSDLKSVITEVVDMLIRTETPKNPYIKTPFGQSEADMVFLNVFYKSVRRQAFSISPSNQYFICLAHYYCNETVPRLTHGGIPESIWAELRQEQLGNTHLAWNPGLNT